MSGTAVHYTNHCTPQSRAKGLPFEWGLECWRGKGGCSGKWWYCQCWRSYHSPFGTWYLKKWIIWNMQPYTSIFCVANCKSHRSPGIRLQLSFTRSHWSQSWKKAFQLLFFFLICLVTFSAFLRKYQNAFAVDDDTYFFIENKNIFGIFYMLFGFKAQLQDSQLLQLV